MVKRTILKSFGTLLLLTVYCTNGQVRISELMSTNTQTIFDEDGVASDWLELYNYGDTSVNLDGFGLSDHKNAEFWTFPAYTLDPGAALLIFASGKDIKNPPYHYSTIIDIGDTWAYFAPTTQPPTSWRLSGFDDAAWQRGKSGFGYGDNDDSTIVLNARTIYIRKTFTLSNLSEIQGLILHVDYDDAFVAYLNGTEVARGNITSNGPPAFDAFADNPDHEAKMFAGGKPEPFVIDTDELIEGSNLLAIEVHNGTAASSDLSLIPFLSIGSLEPMEDSLSHYLEIAATGFHADFKLSNDGETVYLRNPDGSAADSVYTGDIPSDISRGRPHLAPDTWALFDVPSPGETNPDTGKSKISSPAVFSTKGGYYTQNLNVTLSAGGNSQIYYTIDGSAPTQADRLYQGPISIQKPTVIRAIAVEPDAIASKSVTTTYIVKKHHDLPVVSISTDPENLWDETTGIYATGPNASNQLPYYGANFWEDWERPIHIELYEPDGELAFSEDAGVKIFGAWSRANAQKSLAIHFRSEYGSKNVKYRIFDNLDLDEFSSLVLRNGGNDWNRTMFHDAFSSSLFHPSLDKQAFRPAVVYINGEYWGILNIREKVNEDFLGDHHDIDPDEINMMEANSAVLEGNGDSYKDLISYLNSYTLTSQANFDYVATQMDVVNYMHYSVGNILIDNQDWPGNNIKWWKATGDTTRWRWIVYDTEYSMGIYDDTRYSANSINAALSTSGPGWPNPPWSTFLLRRLMTNAAFKRDFINAIADQLNTNFQPEFMNERITEMADQISSEIGSHAARWGSSQNFWNQEVQKLRTFSNNRRQYVQSHIQSTFKTGPPTQLTLSVKSGGTVKLNTLQLNEFPWTGEYFRGNPVVIEAVPGPGYKFVRWDGDKQLGTAKVTINLDSATSLTAVFEPINWDLVSVVINEINYNSDNSSDSDDWIELHHNGPNDLDLTGWYLSDDDPEHKYLLPDMDFSPNDYLVICRDESKFQSIHPDVSNTSGNMEFGLSANGDCVRLYNADEVLVDEVCYTNSAPWPLEPDGLGYTLALTDPSFNNSLPANWFSGEANGTPGRTNGRALGIDLEAILLYPNPAVDFISLKINDQAGLSLRIYNELGQIVAAHDDLSVHSGKEHLTLRLPAQLSSGVYFLEISGSAGSQVQRFIVERN